MMESVEVYGFGSYFRGDSSPSDIDVLLVHKSASFNSIKFVITCKSKLAELLINPDITMLTTEEESHIGFIQKSNAKHIGTIFEPTVATDITEILRNFA